MRRLIARLEARNAELHDKLSLIRPHVYETGDWTAYDRIKSEWLHNEAQIERLYLRMMENTNDRN